VKDFHGNDPRFIFYFLNFLDLSRYASGVSVPTLNRNLVHPIKIQVPPVSEQRAIAHVLRFIQEAKEARQRELSLEHERKAALMKHLFTHGTRGEGRKQTEIGEIPESWQVSKFGALADIQYGYQTSIPSERPINGVEIISTAEILNEGRLDLSKIRTVEIPEHRIERYSIAAQDILFNWRNAQAHVGKTALVEFSPEKPLIYTSFILRIRAVEPAYYRFLHFALSYLRNQCVFFRLSRRAVNQANFNANELANLQIPLPSSDEQYEIVEAMDLFDVKIAALEKESSLLEELFRAMLEQLMTARLSAMPLIETELVELETPTALP
jgi:type I restriction enzyme S subunit